eukprot:615889-Pyramimonas_sp.AAC.1
MWRYVWIPPYGRLRWPRGRKEVLGPLHWQLTPLCIGVLVGEGDPSGPYDGSRKECEAYDGPH